MDVVTQYSRAYRRAYERSISKQKFENHPHFSSSHQDFLKGQLNLRKIHENNSYQQENAVRFDEDCDRAKDLRIDKGNNDNYHQQQRLRVINLQKNGNDENIIENCATIKQEINPPSEISPPPTLLRRYFCIFCKLDYSSADDFLEHLELHPNGSFVLVKKESPSRVISSSVALPSPQATLALTSPKIIFSNKTFSNNDVENIDGGGLSPISAGVINNNNNNHHYPHNLHNKTRQDELDVEEETSNLPILPEMLKNQIKIEPISEDDDEEEDNHISNNTLNNQTIQDAPQYNKNNHNNNNNKNNNNKMNSSTEMNSPESQSENCGDPNQQLLVLSNPRIGDGPGEYLCNVCQAKFVYKNNLKSHLKRHLGIYPYVCFCGKRYQFKCKLNKHIEQAHAKIKNFKCPVPTCPKKYFTRNDLAFHISVTHQERQEIPCNICQKVFNSQKSLQIHCRKYHRNQES